MSMTLKLLTLGLLIPLVASAQKNEVVDSIDVETGIIYYADSTQVSNMVSSDTIVSTKSPIPQIPLDECDSLMVNSPSDGYGVVWKDGRCGIYDIAKWENVTKIEYKDLWFSFRREIEGEYYSYFGWDENDTKGVIGIAEVNNQFITISMPKVQDENDNEEKKEK